MKDAQSIGRRIAALRKGAGMTQEQLAERLGVSPQAVSKWENDISCPDISMLPAIAEVFGVSADALLGMQPMKAAESAPQNAQQNATESAPQSAPRRPLGDSLWVGLVLILVGAAYLMGRVMELPFDLWGLVWPSALLGLGVAEGLKRRSPLLLGAGLLGLLCLLKNLSVELPFELSWGNIWPGALILLGLNLITDRLWPARGESITGHLGGCVNCSYSEDGGMVRSEVSFGEDARRVQAQCVTGVSIEVSFGSLELDFTDSGFQKGALLSVDVSFGSCRLILPSTVQAAVSVSSSFGGADTQGAPKADAIPLPVTGSVAFGSLKIEYR